VMPKVKFAPILDQTVQISTIDQPSVFQEKEAL
jgi:hypothetical protein